MKVLRNIEIVDHSGKDITVANYQILFKDPDAFHRKKGMVKYLLLELTELGQFECFGEDVNTISNFMLTSQHICKAALPYSIISAMPLECYCIRKKEFYEYINDVTKKKFIKYIRSYPKDKDLRRFYYEQTHWKDFR